MITNEKRVIYILLMRFAIEPHQGTIMAQAWLQEHPQSDWETLLTLLKDNRLVPIEGVLKHISTSNQANKPKPIRKYRGIEIPTNTVNPREQSQSKPPSKQKLKYRGLKY